MLYTERRTGKVSEKVPEAKVTRVPRAADVVNRIHERLREMTINYELRPQERINEVELSARLAVSRTPVREALNRLVAEGLMTFVPNKGFYCRAFDTDEVLHLFEARAALETRAVELACERAPVEELSGLRDWWRQVEREAEAMTAAELTDQDEAFHLRIADAARNPEFGKLLIGINARIRFVRQIEIEAAARRATTFREHEEIADALAARDAPAADRKSTRLNSSHSRRSRMPSSA